MNILETFYICDDMYALAEKDGRYGLYHTTEQNIRTGNFTTNVFRIGIWNNLKTAKEDILDFVKEQTSSGRYYDGAFSFSL